MTPEVKKFNGLAAMLDFISAFGAYATTDLIIPIKFCFSLNCTLLIFPKDLM
tara:strand:+ start:25 stop:180 length:156 start_codon:yes stop_codon:yes gene_type:complete